MGRRTTVCALVLIGASVLLSGCGKKDATEQAAPPPSPNAQGLGNYAGRKPMVGAAGAQQAGGGQQPQGAPAGTPTGQ